MVLLRRAGFNLRYDASKEQWFAEYRDFIFRADNPIELLGLTAIYRDINPSTPSEDWWQINDPDILSELDPGS